MDPTNNPNPIPTPMLNPTPTPNPVPPAQTSMPGSASTPSPMPQSAQPISQSVQQPVQQPTPQPMPQPVQSAPQPTMSTAEFFESTETSQPMPSVNISATDPITQPEPAPAPDPVEEALKAPFQAAGPVPGSIGSTISMPAADPTLDQTNIPNQNPVAQPANLEQPKKKTSRGTLIFLCILAVILIAGLGVVLYMSMTGNDIFNIFGMF